MRPFWAKGGRNSHEASSSRGPPRRRSVPTPVAPPRGPAAAADATAARVGLEVAQLYRERRQPLPWGDVHLPEGWHLSRLRVPVPPVPREGRERTEEIRRRRALLPPDLLQDPAYALSSSLWDGWFQLEHNHRRRLAFASTLPPDYAEPEEEAALVGLEPDEDLDPRWSEEEEEEGGGGGDATVKAEPLDEEEFQGHLKAAMEE